MLYLEDSWDRGVTHSVLWLVQEDSLIPCQLLPNHPGKIILPLFRRDSVLLSYLVVDIA